MNVILTKDLNKSNKGKRITQSNTVIFNDIPIYEIINRDEKSFKFTIRNINTNEELIVGAMQVIYIKG